MFGCESSSEKESAETEKVEKPQQESETEAEKTADTFVVTEGVDYSVNDGTLGKLTVGASIDEFSKVYGSESVKESQGNYGARSYQVYLGKNTLPSLEVVPTCDENSCVIAEVFIVDPNFSTSTGIFAGSSVKDLFDRHTGLNLSDDSGRLIMYCNELKHVGFVIDRTNLGPGIALEKVAVDTKIVSLILY